MRIWMINHYAVPPSEPGGTRHYSLARELVRRGHEAVIIAANINHWTRESARTVAAPDGVAFLRLSTPDYQDNGLARFQNMLVFARQVEKETRSFLPPDIIMGSSPHLFAARAASRLAKRYHVPFILEVRDIWPQSLVELGSISPHHPAVLAMRRLERQLYHRAGHIVTLLPGAVQYLQEQGVCPEKVTWVPNGIDLADTPEPQPPISRDALVACYAGAHGVANGLGTLLDCARRLPSLEGGQDILIRFLGDGPQKPALQRQAREWGLGNVSFDAPVPKHQVPIELATADATICILRDSPVFRWGVSPNKLYDYLSAGRPVVFAINTPINPVETSGAGICIPPDDPEALARALIALAKMPAQERWEMGLKGRHYVEEYHDFRKLGERLEYVMKRLVG